MNAFGKFVTVLNSLIVVAVCLYAIVWVVRPGVMTMLKVEEAATFKIKTAEFVGDLTGKTTIVLIGCLLVIMNVMFVARLLRSARYERSIRFQNPSGDVTVQLGAVEECLVRSARDSEDVHDVKVKVFAGTHERPIKVVAGVSLWDARNIPSVIDKLQGRLKARFAEILDTEEPVDVEVTLKRLVTRQEVKKEAVEKESSAAENSFRGPQYPVG